MITLIGTVEDGFGLATTNLAHVVGLIEHRTGLRPLVRGTLNLAIPAPYIVVPDAQVEMHEYNQQEYIKLQRCRISDVRAVVARPNTHEHGFGHGPAYLELLSTVNLRERFGLATGDTIRVELEGDDAWWRT